MEKRSIKKTRYLVTGAAGFVGANLIYALEKLDGADIIAVVHSKSNIWRLKNITSKIKVVECDLINYQEVEKLIETYKPEYIVHLAVKGIYQNQWSNPTKVLKDNYSVDVNLLEVLKNNHAFLIRLITFGSMYEYGNQSGLMQENQVTNVNLGSLYAVSKRVSGIINDYYCKILPIVTLRLSTGYGPYNELAKFVEGSINNFLLKKTIKVAVGVKKDFIYINDITRAIIKALDSKNNINGEIFNIGSGIGYDLGEIAELIESKLALRARPNAIIESKEFKRVDDVSIWMNIEKAFLLLDWKPSFTLEEGITRTIDWYKKNQDILPKTTG